MRCFFFFQAEDGIRDVAVTGVQTCALPILPLGYHLSYVSFARQLRLAGLRPHCEACSGGTGRDTIEIAQIGRASCRGRVEISVVAVSLKKKNNVRRGGVVLTDTSTVLTTAG